jgi:hypothetical protein
MSCLNRADGIVSPRSAAISPRRAAGVPAGAVASAFSLAALLAAAMGAPPVARAADPAPAPPAAVEAAETPATAAAPVPPAGSEDRVTLGVDLVSRYVWRGQIYGDAPCLQPWAGVSVAGFDLSTWGSFPFVPVAGDEAGALTEVDLTLARSLEFPIGTITASVSDYSYPSTGISYFEFAGDGTGAHTVDACLAYRGREGLPLGLCASVNIYNDDQHATYVEASCPFSTGSTSVNLVVGAALGESALYAVEEREAHFIQAGVSVSRPLVISDTFTPILKVSWILNPDAKRVVLVAALSL